MHVFRVSFFSVLFSSVIAQMLSACVCFSLSSILTLEMYYLGIF